MKDRFQWRNQEAGETGSHYLTELRHAAESCDFANITTSHILGDRFVYGMRASKVRERLLREKNLKQKADEVKDTRGEADQVNYVIMRRNKRNQPPSANFAHTSVHPNNVRPKARNVVSVVR